MMKRKSFYNKHLPFARVRTRIALWLFLAAVMFIGKAEAQRRYVIMSGVTYMERYHDGSEWKLRGTTTFNPESCIWLCDDNRSNTHNYYFVDKNTSERYYIYAPFTAGGNVTLALPSGNLANTDNGYYFYDWDWGLARGKQHAFSEFGDGQCPAGYHSPGSECWEVYWVMYDGQWVMSTASYSILQDCGIFKSVRLIEHPLTVTDHDGGLTTLGSGTLEIDYASWSAGQTLNGLAQYSPSNSYSGHIIPAYLNYGVAEIECNDANWTSRQCDTSWISHNWYGTPLEDHHDVPPSAISSGPFEVPPVTPIAVGNSYSYTWTLSGPGAAYLSFSPSSEVTELTRVYDNGNAYSVDDAAAKLYYRVANTRDDATATLTLTITYPDGATQSSSRTLTVRRYIPAPSSLSVENLTFVEGGSVTPEVTFGNTGSYDTVDYGYILTCTDPNLTITDGKTLSGTVPGVYSVRAASTADAAVHADFSVTLRPKSPTITFSYVPDNSTANTNITKNSSAAVFKNRYTTDGSDPSCSSTEFTAAFHSANNSEVRAVTCVNGVASEVTVAVCHYDPANGGSTESTAFQIWTLSDLDNIAGKNFCKLMTDVDASSYTTIASFAGTFEAAIDPSTHMPYRIKNLSVPLFTTLTGTVKNLVLEDVDISQTGKVGAIACTANGTGTGAARIYNVGILSGTVKSTGTSTANNSTDCCGGLVGLLDGEARVVNCYSYANITGGNRVGGLVGYNNVQTTSSNLKTMVNNCMFYGEIDTLSSNNIAPIYNGKIISNTGSTGVSNFNYFKDDAIFVQHRKINTYNCALMAETRFLQRFEFFRHLLNGHRELAGWWATGTYSKSAMHKWVMLPDSIGTAHPFPILMNFGKYPSVVNYDAEHAVEGKLRNQGGKLGTLTVNIQMGDGAVYNHPGEGDTEAQITTPQLTLNITDKDTAHFNFNYYKVQLPYYNDVGTKNYTGNRVVTGWKIVKINEQTAASSPSCYSTGSDAPAYNFADRNCTDKDLFSVSGRIFNQGAYWDVPEGVESITIEPYWAKCVYLADPYADVVYNQSMDNNSDKRYDVLNVGDGQKYNDGDSYSIAEDNQVVFTTMGNAITSSGTGNALFQGVDASSHTAYDYAVVLVGNYHFVGISGANLEASSSKPYTVTSIDLDGDNEPDYSYILRFNGRTAIHPVRVDFINIPGLGMAQKSTGGTGTYNFGILQPKYFFESTNTSLFRVTQFEYDAGRDVSKPYIVQGGVFEQWVGGQGNEHKNKITFFHVGGNVWFKEFHRGSHQDRLHKTKHPPVSVTGGDFDEFYLTGLYANSDNYNDNAECYINGGRFGTVCGAAMEGIGKAEGADNTGNITWKIQNADIKEFFAGGLNAAKPVTGNLSTTITDSYIGIYCGGPKFGDMSTNKTVTTTATGCTFGTFFGAGYGGNSYYPATPGNFTNVSSDPWNAGEKGLNLDWDKWVRCEIKGKSVNNGNYSNLVTYTGYNRDYISEFGGVSVAIDYQFIPMSDNKTNVGRLFLKFVKFSKAVTYSVISNLKDCTIDGNFYGGGSLGKVNGNVVSTLEDCTVYGNVFGAGYSASLPKAPVMNRGGFTTQPYFDKNLGVYLPGEFLPTVDYEWVYSSTTVSSTETAVDTINHKLYTNEDLTTLGTVTGNVKLTLKGNCRVGTILGDGTLKRGTGNVFGGGEDSKVGGNTNVYILGHSRVEGNVYGGGNEGEVQGATNVQIGGVEN